MTRLITRYENDLGHGWYVGSDTELVLAAGEPEVWPGIFEAYCRLRGTSLDDVRFRSPADEAEFLRDVRGDDVGVPHDGGTTSGSAG